jgi:thiol-disulfide isomerase/thioredoxin
MSLYKFDLRRFLVKNLVKTVSLLLVMNAVLSGNVYGQPKNAKPGETLPDVALPDTSGNVQRLTALIGKVVLIDFWASWCGPCRQSNPALAKLYDKYHSKDFEIYGVSVDKSASAWKHAINTDKIHWVQVNDNGRANAEGTAEWEINYIPTSILLDRKGKIVALNPTVRQINSYLKKHL